MSEDTQTQWTAETILSFLDENRVKLRAMGVKKIGLFGSYGRGDQSSESDVDILFSMDHFTWAAWMDVWNFLEDELGLSIDLVPEKDLRKEIRQQVMAEVRYVEEF